MKIAIIGAGMQGGALARRLAERHEVYVGSRDAARGLMLSMELGCSGGAGYGDAAVLCDTIVLSVPWDALGATLATLGDLSGKLVIDTVNPFTGETTWDIVELPGTSVAEELQRRLPATQVVKAWNTLPAGLVAGSPLFSGMPASAFLCGDDDTARAQVAALSRELGFAPIDCGPLSSARHLESLAGLNARLSYHLGMGTDHAINVVER